MRRKEKATHLFFQECLVQTLWIFIIFQVVFRPPYKNFELIIRLVKNVNVLRHQAVDSSKMAVPSTAAATQKTARDQYEPLPVVEFNVCRKFLQDLKVCISFGND